MAFTLVDDEPVRESVKKAKFELLDEAPNPTGSFFENAKAGLGKVFVDAGRSIGQVARDAVGPSQGLQALASREGKTLDNPIADAAGLPSKEDIKNARELDAPLMKTGGGLVGNVAGNVGAALMVPGGNTYGGAMLAGGALGALQPVAEGESRALNTGIGVGLGAGGKYVGDKIAGGVKSLLASREAANAAAKTQNAVRDAALEAGKEAGYVVPPRMVQKQGPIGSLLEGFGGKVKTEQLASNKNQEVTNTLARKALGVEPDAPITKELLTGIRAKAGEAYEALRGAGTITADKQFGTDLAKITQKYQGASKDFPELAKNEIANVVQSINKPSFSSSAAIDAISILRDKSAAAFASGDKAVGSAYKQTSQAMEDAIERNLIEHGSADAVKAFQAARKLIAKTYTIENALSATGDVSAGKVAAQLSKGKPLSDELKTIGSFAGAFPKATQSTAKVEPHSILDIASMAGLGTAGAGPGALVPLARPGARSLVLSKAYQKLMASPEYETSALLRGAASGAKVLPKVLPGSAALGALEYVK